MVSGKIEEKANQSMNFIGKQRDLIISINNNHSFKRKDQIIKDKKPIFSNCRNSLRLEEELELCNFTERKYLSKIIVYSLYMYNTHTYIHKLIYVD